MTDPVITDPSTGEVIRVHPIADLFPLLLDDELGVLAAEIADVGLDHPIVLDDEGRILDGRNRCRACWIAGVKPEFVTYDGVDPHRYALSANLSRRHMTQGQRAMIAARGLVLNTTSTHGSAAEAVGVSRESVMHAKVVLDHAPDLVDAVVSGAMVLNKAYDEARDRKRAADDTEAQMLRLRAEAPDLADRVAEEQVSFGEALTLLRQREEDRLGAIRRAQGRLREAINGWSQVSGLATNPDRDEILAGLVESDQAVIAEIEEAIHNNKGKKTR